MTNTLVAPNSLFRKASRALLAASLLLASGPFCLWADPPPAAPDYEPQPDPGLGLADGGDGGDGSTTEEIGPNEEPVQASDFLFGDLKAGDQPDGQASDVFKTGDTSSSSFIIKIPGLKQNLDQGAVWDPSSERFVPKTEESPKQGPLMFPLGTAFTARSTAKSQAQEAQRFGTAAVDDAKKAAEISKEAQRKAEEAERKAKEAEKAVANAHTTKEINEANRKVQEAREAKDAAARAQSNAQHHAYQAQYYARLAKANANGAVDNAKEAAEGAKEAREEARKGKLDPKRAEEAGQAAEEAKKYAAIAESDAKHVGNLVSSIVQNSQDERNRAGETIDRAKDIVNESEKVVWEKAKVALGSEYIGFHQGRFTLSTSSPSPPPSPQASTPGTWVEDPVETYNPPEDAPVIGEAASFEPIPLDMGQNLRTDLHFEGDVGTFTNPIFLEPRIDAGSSISEASPDASGASPSSGSASVDSTPIDSTSCGR